MSDPSLPVDDGRSEFVDITKHGGINRVQVTAHPTLGWFLTDTTHRAHVGVLKREGAGYILEAPTGTFVGNDWVRLIDQAL